MEFGIGKCGVLSLKRGKVIESEGIVMPNGEVMRSMEETGYKYLGVLEMDQILEKQMKDKVQSEYFRRLKLVLKTKLNGKNKIQAINTWAVAILRYGGGILDWKTEELKAMDRRSRKFLTMYGALHPKSDVDRLYIPRKKGGRGLAGCEKSVKAEVNSIGWYIHNSDEPLLQEVQEKEIVEARDCVSKNEYRRRDLDQSEEKWRNKKMYGQYVREVSESADEGKMWRWLSKCDLKPETEALICAAQEQAIRTNYVKCNIDKSVASPLCRLCHEKGESISHVVSECKKLAHVNAVRIQEET